MMRTKADRRPSPGLTLNLSSNNPFRNRLPSPSRLPSPNLRSPQSASSDQSAHRISRNPFLADFEQDNKPVLGGNMATAISDRSSPRKSTFDPSAKEMFVSGSLSHR